MKTKKGIEMKGEEKELKEYFDSLNKSLEKNKPKIFDPKKWTQKQKIFVIVSFFILVFILLTIFGVGWIMDSWNHKNYLTPEECNAKLNQYLTYVDMPWYKILVIGLMPWMGGIALAIILGWIFHGVGFKIIG